MNIDRLADSITSKLESYSNEKAKEVKKIVDETTKELAKNIKKSAKEVGIKGSGEYIKAFRIKVAYEDRFNKKNVWYVAKPHYRLAHLLEKGHLSKNGVGRTKAYPHILPNEEKAKADLERRIKEVCGE